MDLTESFALAQSLVSIALATSGTTVDLRRGADEKGGTVNTATLLPVTPTAPVTYATAVPALVVGAAGEINSMPSTTTTAPVFTVIVGPDNDVHERDEVLVTACLDERIVGVVLVVTSVLRSSANAALRLATVPLH